MRRALIALFAALILAPAARAAPAPDVRLYAMDCGRFDLPDADGFSDDGAYKGVPKKLVVPCYLIRHPKGDLIWDTGLPEAQGSHKLLDQLKQLGLTPADIEYLSISHSHYDHIGAAGLFAGSTWLVDPRERDWAFRPAARADKANFPGYSALESTKTVLIDKDVPYDVFGDGSVLIIRAPGHTPGHTVLLVRFRKSEPLLLTGDMWHIAESRPARRVPRFNFNKADTLRSMTMVEELARAAGARVVIQHVPEDFDRLPKFPLALR